MSASGSPLCTTAVLGHLSWGVSRVVPKIPDVWFPSLSPVPKVVQSQTVSSFSRWPLATTLWNVVTNKHKSVSLSPNLPVVLKAFQKCVLIQSLELPGHLYQRHLDYLEDKVSALKPYLKIERGIFFSFIYWKDLSLSVLSIYWLCTWPSTFRHSSALPHHGNLSLCQYLTVLTWLA